MDNTDLRTWDEVWEEIAPQVEYLLDLEEREDIYADERMKEIERQKLDAVMGETYED